LRYYMAKEGLKYDFIVHPGGNPKNIQVQFNDQVNLDIHSSKVEIISATNPDHLIMVDNELRVFQRDETPIFASFKSESLRQYGFEIADFDLAQDLIIDPIWLGFSTYLGGSSAEWGVDIVVDRYGNSFITGKTGSADFPSKNAYQGKAGGYDVFICKLNATGNGLVYSTFLGGGDTDSGVAIAIDDFGNTYITGNTLSTDFPTKNAYQTDQPGYDCFITKLSPLGSEIIYSTYLGGSVQDYGNSITVDNVGNAYITGWTTSNDFPTKNSIQLYNASADVFVTKLNTTGNGLVYSTYLGGNSYDEAKSITIGTNESVYLTGETASTNFPVKNAYQMNNNGNKDVFITQINATGNGLMYSSYLGGSGFDYGKGITMDRTASIYIGGSTTSTDFPTINGFQNSFGGGITDAFITKINASGDVIIYSTYIGGDGSENGQDIVVDDLGHTSITGETYSSDFPTKHAFQDFQGESDVFVSALAIDNFGSIYVIGQSQSLDFPTINAYQDNSAGTDLIAFKISRDKFSSYLGGSDIDQGYDITIDSIGNIYVTGYTFSPDFPTKNPLQTFQTWDAFVTKLDAISYEIVYSTYLGGDATDYGKGIAVDDLGNVYVCGDTYSSNFPILNPYQQDLGTADVFVTKLNSTGNGLIYSTFLGGIGIDYSNGIILDNENNVYVAGATSSLDFPIVNGYQSIYNGGFWDGFVSKLNNSGNGLIYSTYLGGNADDGVNGIALDMQGNTYVTGSTTSSNFTTQNPYQTYQDRQDIFITKLNATGNGLVFSTYLGGNETESGIDIDIDNSHNVYITGETDSLNIPVMNGYQTSFAGGQNDGYLAKLNSTGNGLVYSTYLGGNSSDRGAAIEVDEYENVNLVGTTSSSDFPTVNSFQAFHGFRDVFVTRFNSTGNGLIFSTYLGGNNYSQVSGLVIDDGGCMYLLGDTRASDFPLINAFQREMVYFELFITKLGIDIDDIIPQVQLNDPSKYSVENSGYHVELEVFDSISFLDEVEFAWDNNPYQEYNSTVSIVLPTGDGAHDLHVFVNDSAGNSNSAIFYFITDDTLPAITLQTPNESSFLNSGSLINLNISDANLESVVYNWDENANQSVSNPSEIPLAVGDGQHILYIYARDYAGNWAHANFTFITDDTVPVIEVLETNSISYRSDTSLHVNITEINVQQVLFNWDANDNATLVGPDYSTILPVGNGPHTLQIYVQDLAGNWGSEAIAFV
ncbi:MAG: SBBP repeat-containing protein, partial [Candidatus Kariarchaeaceae archaeon]